MRNKDTKIVIENTSDLVRIVNISYFNDTIMMSTDRFERDEIDMDYFREGIVENLSDMLDIEILIENPTMSFNDFVDQEVEEWDSNLDILGEVVAFESLDSDTINLFRYMDRCEDTNNPFSEMIAKYHKQKVDEIPQELLRICDIVEQEVDQEPYWYKNGMEIF